MSRLILAPVLLVAGVSFSDSSEALDPATWGYIASGVVAYFESQEGQCLQHGASCQPNNVGGASARCHEVARRIRKFVDEPNDYTAKQVYAITGSARTQCMARRLMGTPQWDSFSSRRGDV